MVEKSRATRWRATLAAQGGKPVGVTLTPDATRVIEPGQPLRLRYALWVHNGVPGGQTVDQQWQTFVGQPLPELKVKHKPH